MKFRFILSSVLAALALHMGTPSRVRGEDVSSSFDAKGVKIHYIVRGAGTPVVLIHGLGASAEKNWGLPGIIDALAKDHQVIAMDLPGHGQSDKPEGDEAYGEQMAEDIILLMDHLKIPKAHIVGYSMGGMITAKLMVTHPDRMISGILGGWGFMKEGSKGAEFWEKLGNGDRGAQGAGRPAAMGGASAVPRACVHGFTRLAITEDELKAVKVPMEVIVGERDLVKRMYVEPLEAVRNDWPVVEIKDAGHIMCVIKPEFKEEIVKWVAAHDK